MLESTSSGGSPMGLYDAVNRTYHLTYWLFGIGTMSLTGLGFIWRYVQRRTSESKERTKLLNDLVALMRETAGKVKIIEAEIRPNGGGSIKDAVGRMERSLTINTLLTQQGLNASGKPCFILDEHGACVWVSEEWSRLTGTSAAQAAGNSWSVAISDADRERVFEGLLRCCREGRPFLSTHFYRTGVQVETETTPLPGPHGRVMGFFGRVRVLAMPAVRRDK